jgi:mycofactocin precursor
MSETVKIAEARTPAPERDPVTMTDTAPDAEPRAEELLIEEVSIDGMCGVY